MADIETEYEKVTQHQHILLRPDTYIGSVEPIIQELLVFKDGKLQYITFQDFVPGFYKIIDEIVVNAIDQRTNTKNSRKKDERMDTLMIKMNENQIIIANNGRGIPVKKLKKYDNVYAPEMIMGQLLTSSNYKDNQAKVTGGRNGYGAKLTNIYSTYFKLETCDGEKYYSQTWKNNMYEKGDAIITKNKHQFTKINFKPDLAKFKLNKITENMKYLIYRRAIDAAVWCKGQVKVEFNNNKIQIDTLEKYALNYTNNRNLFSYKSKCGNWEFVLTYNEKNNFEQISYVNGISTIRGGKHVDYIVKQFTKIVSEILSKREKTKISQKSVKTNLLIFLRAVIVNPTFDGQTKEKLTTPIGKFGSECVLNKQIVDKALKTVPELIALSIAQAEFKNSRILKRTDGTKRKSIRGIPKLCDATYAGGRKSKECVLILTEGDSAKTMALSGLSAIKDGRQIYGVFPLKGKLLNVKGLSLTKIAENKEISSIKQILGLKTGVTYDHIKKWPLRYGKIMIMTDQDVDGSHIKGLLINMFHTYWPSLLKIGFITALVTPILKALPKNKKKQSVLFYSMNDYIKWKNTNNNKKYRIKYYKGLGTSDRKEAREYFSTHKKEVKYNWSNNCNKNLNLAFNKSCADDRKEWLKEYDSTSVLDINKQNINISDFIQNELIHFSHYDVHRSIPSVIDGLKPSQRKILYACLKRKLTNEIKVSQLSGYVSEHAAYHHGEVSLQGAIVGMAQNFIGSNNLPLLVPKGQFGSRLQGGSDSASSRYIFTKLDPLTSLLFPESDFPLLDYLEDDGFKIEPKYYIPIIPIILCNGAKGIGTGWSTDVPSFNPIDVTNQVLNWIDNKPITEIKPWFKNFSGVIEKIDNHSYLSRGVCQIENKTNIRILELPISTWTLNYKQYIEKIMDKGKMGLIDIEDVSTDTSVNILLKFENEEDINKLQPNNPSVFHDKIRLSSKRKCSCKNIYLFDSTGHIKKFNIQEIIIEFCKIRKNLYIKRYKHQLLELATKKELLNEKKRFIEGVISNQIKIMGIPLITLENNLEQIHNFNPKIGGMPHIGKGRFKYLTSMPIASLTREKIMQVSAEVNEAIKNYNLLESITPMKIWGKELKLFKKHYKKKYNL